MEEEIIILDLNGEEEDTIPPCAPEKPRPRYKAVLEIIAAILLALIHGAIFWYAFTAPDPFYETPPTHITTNP